MVAEPTDWVPGIRVMSDCSPIRADNASAGSSKLSSKWENRRHQWDSRQAMCPVSKSVWRHGVLEIIDNFGYAVYSIAISSHLPENPPSYLIDIINVSGYMIWC